ncbi:TIM-barrel domain-containing protein [Granulicella sp. dw_53]|uniref:glycoside hydrolase family 31 protein n=1 Tax=Granulicella sp. dw_53 TaxID=2719792 RepID=UPI002107F234|nr:TIM-barrel domain-containing protein [Granulicella sp. dw_53]
MRKMVGIAGAMLSGTLWAMAQDGAPKASAPEAPVQPVVAAPSGRSAEVPVSGMVRRDMYTVAVALPDKRIVKNVDEGKDLLLHDFSFDDVAVTTNKLHFKELAPGVMEITSTAYSMGMWQFLVRDAANYYGLGERFNTLNHARTIVKNASQDNGIAKGAGAYKAVPFFMSTSGYGLWVDTTAEATFDLNATSITDIQVSVPAEKLRVVVFKGPEFPKILERFTGITQRTILPPYWAFAPWMGRDFHQNDAQVREDVDKTRALGLPASVIVIDSPWTTSYNSYKFNPKQFDDAPGMIKHLHDEGYKLVLWHTSWINSQSNEPGEAGFAGKMLLHSESYDEAAANGYFVKKPDGTPYVGRWWKGLGSLIDFTNPSAKNWWQDQVRQAIKAGADGFKDDDAEGNFQGDVKFADGSNKLVMRNRYGMLYNNAMEELIQKDLKGNGVLFARSVTTGANGIGFLWGGDNEASFSPENGLPTVVTAGLNAGMSGMSLWAADLGGYLKTATTPDPLLVMRWTEFAAFSPTMEILSQSNTQPWDWDAKTGGTQALDVYRKYSLLHMSLFPYRYAAAQESAKTGMPILRALALVYQDDDRARLTRDEYLFGPDLLVAPVVDENTRRPVYLPAGEWVDYWTGTAVTGGKVIAVDAAVDKIPVYVRAGAVIPKIPEDVMTLVPQSESGNTKVKSLDDRRVYELNDAEGAGSITDFEGRSVVRSGRTLKISGDSAAHMIVRWRFVKPKNVTVNGAAVKLVDGGAAVEFDHLKESVVEWR